MRVTVQGNGNKNPRHYCPHGPNVSSRTSSPCHYFARPRSLYIFAHDFGTKSLWRNLVWDTTVAFRTTSARFSAPSCRNIFSRSIVSWRQRPLMRVQPPSNTDEPISVCFQQSLSSASTCPNLGTPQPPLIDLVKFDLHLT